MFRKSLNFQHPIVLAPMAGVGTPELCAIISNCDGLGSLPTGYLTLEQAKENIRRVKVLTHKSYIVNLFIPELIQDFDQEQTRAMRDYLNGLRQKLKLEPINSNDFQANNEDLDDWIAMLIQEKVPAVSFTFGSLTATQVRTLQNHHIVIIGTATHVAEALHLKKAGCDAIIAQGYEAGGHQGSFIKNKSNPIGTMALIPQLVDALAGTPVIAAGGISDGRGIAAALSLGAEVAQLGTVFIPAVESEASPMYKNAILNSNGLGTVLTQHVSGKQARASASNWLDELAKYSPFPYPLQHDLTRDIRKTFVIQNNKEMATFWSGQASSLARGGYAEEIMQQLECQYKEVFKSMLARYRL